MKLQSNSKIVPCLWFDTQAEAAIAFYLSIFPNGKVKSVTRNGDLGPGPKGSPLVVAFELEGLSLLALNGGPRFKLNEAISLVVNCDTQEEIDRYWEQLSAGGQTQACGWLKDKFGLSWQIAPAIISELLQDADETKAQRVMEVILKSKKLDIAALKKAHAG